MGAGSPEPYSRPWGKYFSQFHSSNSRLKTAGRTDTHYPYPTCPLWTYLHEGGNNRRITTKSKRTDIGFVYSPRNLLLHLGLGIILAIHKGLEHHTGRLEMAASYTYSKRTRRTSKLCHTLGRPFHDFIQNDLRVVFVEDSVGLCSNRRTATEH